MIYDMKEAPGVAAPETPKNVPLPRNESILSPSTPLSPSSLLSHLAFCVSPASWTYDHAQVHSYRGDGVPRTAGGRLYEPLTGWEEVRRV